MNKKIDQNFYIPKIENKLNILSIQIILRNNIHIFIKK